MLTVSHPRIGGTFHRLSRTSRAKRGASRFLAWWLIAVLVASANICSAAFSAPTTASSSDYEQPHQLTGGGHAAATGDSMNPLETHCPDNMDQVYVTSIVQVDIPEATFTSYILRPVVAVPFVAGSSLSTSGAQGRNRLPIPPPVVFQRVPRLLL